MESKIYSRLSVFNSYDYYHVTAAKRDLNESEKRFMNFCMDNHDVICDGNTDDNDPIIIEASNIYCEID